MARTYQHLEANLWSLKFISTRKQFLQNQKKMCRSVCRSGLTLPRLCVDTDRGEIQGERESREVIYWNEMRPSLETVLESERENIPAGLLFDLDDLYGPI